MTPEEQKQYWREKAQEERDRLAADPVALAEYKAKRSAWRKENRLKNLDARREEERLSSEKWREEHKNDPGYAEKRREYNRVFNERHHEQRLAEARDYRASHLEECRTKDREAARSERSTPEGRAKSDLMHRIDRLKRYGLTIESFEKMKAGQGNKCLICSREFKILSGGEPHTKKTNCCVDHDHKTGAVRGLLCDSCNKAIGAFRESPAVMLRTVQYLAGKLVPDGDCHNPVVGKSLYRDGLFLMTYGISEEEFNKLLSQQNGACAACRELFVPAGNGRRNSNICVDHNHADGKVRGLLCERCNKGLGYFRDDERALLMAADYVRGINRIIPFKSGEEVLKQAV